MVLVPADGLHHSYDVYYRFVPHIIPYMQQVPYWSHTFEILTQSFETGRYGVGEHLVEGAGELEPTTHKKGFYLHVASGVKTVNARLNNGQKITLKDGQLRLIYLSNKANSAIIPRGFHCFFHTRCNKKTLDELLESIQTPENAKKILSFKAIAGKVIEEDGGQVNSRKIEVELDPYAAGLIQEIREIRIRCRKGLKKYVNKKVELFILHFLHLCINGRSTYTITDDDIQMIDDIKKDIGYYRYNQLFSADILASLNDVPVEKLNNIFTRFHGISLDAYIQHHRIEKIVHLLTNTRQSISFIALLTGFKNYQAFTAYFIAYFGCAPSRFR